jgi:hypothetical protein
MNAALATTTVCRECGRRFPRGRRSNRHRRASGSPHNGARFCSSGCKQAAYRKRNAERLKVVQGTDAHTTVTRSVQYIENVEGIRTRKTVRPSLKLAPSGPIMGPAHVLDAEVFGGRIWEHTVSSGGVPIQVGRLRARSLVERVP